MAHVCVKSDIPYIFSRRSIMTQPKEQFYLGSHVNFLDKFYQVMPLVDKLLADADHAHDNEDILSNHLDIISRNDVHGFQTVLEVIHGSHLQISAIYWVATTWFLLHGWKKELPMREPIWSFVKSCFTSTGGFSPSPGEDAHILSTYSAIQLCVLYGFKIDKVGDEARKSIINYIASLQIPSDGSFKGDVWGEIDTRFSYCAIASMSLLGADALKALDLDKAVKFIKSCSNFDGCYGATPGCESHAGQIFCCVAVLYIAGKLDEQVDIPKLGSWLAQRQHDSEGGLNGRPEKLQDVCYSWWVLSSLTVIQKQHWIDRKALVSFILSCQDGQRGGFSDRPGNIPDVFHTLFAISGLSLLGYKYPDVLEGIDPVYCLPKEVLNKYLSR